MQRTLFLRPPMAVTSANMNIIMSEPKGDNGPQGTSSGQGCSLPSSSDTVPLELTSQTKVVSHTMERRRREKRLGVESNTIPTQIRTDRGRCKSVS